MTSVEESSIDPAVVAALDAEHAVELRAVLRGLLRDPHLVDDALRATFTKTLQAGHTVQAGSHKAWLFRVAANEALVMLRRQEVRDRALERLGWSSGSSGSRRSSRRLGSRGNKMRRRPSTR